MLVIFLFFLPLLNAHRVCSVNMKTRLLVTVFDPDAFAAALC